MTQSRHKRTIWTIGHSTRTLDEFIGMLKSFQIAIVADIRRFPGSKKYPHFNREVLQSSLWENGIDYIHFETLGGRRKVQPDSRNTAWRNPSFQGYADYTETFVFKNAMDDLKAIASKKRTAYMCSEAVWWRCHRALVSDFLKFEGFEVMHIMGLGKSEEHPFTSPAKIKHNGLSYEEK